MRRAEWLAGLLILAGAATAAEPRYELRARLLPQASSADGRFRLSAHAERLRPPSPAGQRYTLKQAATPAASCPDGDGLYANGFEG